MTGQIGTGALRHCSAVATGRSTRRSPRFSRRCESDSNLHAVHSDMSSASAALKAIPAEASCPATLARSSLARLLSFDAFCRLCATVTRSAYSSRIPGGLDENSPEGRELAFANDLYMSDSHSPTMPRILSSGSLISYGGLRSNWSRRSAMAVASAISRARRSRLRRACCEPLISLSSLSLAML
jgi:hypothetical protein